MASEKKAFFVQWRIENFLSWLQKQEDVLSSPEFTAETMEGTKWRLRISSRCETTMDYVALFLFREVEDDGPEMIHLDYELCFLADEQELPLKIGKFTTEFGNLTSSDELLVRKDVILAHKRQDYLPQGNLTVSCRMRLNKTSVVKNGRCFIRSEIGAERIMLHGIIENFSGINNYGGRTVKFVSPSTGICLVSVKVSSNSSNDLRIDRIRVRNEFIFTGKLFFIDGAGNTTECTRMNFTKKYDSSNASCWFQVYNSGLIDGDFLPNDVLTLHYETVICPGIKSENIEYEFLENDSDLLNSNSRNFDEQDSVPRNNPRSEPALKQPDIEGNPFEFATSFKSDMLSFYSDHLFCDTSFQTGSATFPAHRSVLSARSPVFKKMFTTDMKDKAGERITITDLSSDVVRRMLLFIYTDTIEDLDWENAKALYFAADKYEITTLKQRCSFFIQQNLDPSNVGEILVLADRHQDGGLKSAVQEYILKNDQEVFGSDEWKVFMESHCQLAAQIMHMKCLKK